MTEGFELIMRPGAPPHSAPGRKAAPPPRHSLNLENGLLIERDVQVPMRDGVRIYVDIYRPAPPAVKELPVLLGWSPYGKHNTADHLPWPEAGVAPGWISRYTAFEAPDPLFWCKHGYAVVYPNPRGSWYSEGDLRHGGPGEAEDCYDLIEWLGQQRWSNGNVGMTGVSYLAAIQWQVAPLRPPHLKAINPWEGFSDWYREFAYHGGIPETGFLPRGCANLHWSTTQVEDTAANVKAHPLYDTYWASKECDLEGIVVPAYVVGSWSDQGLHTRGTLDAYTRLASAQKWLEVHGQKKWQYYYRPQSLQRQRQFFDHFLANRPSAITGWPKVLLEIRESAQSAEVRAEGEWPVERTRFRRLFLCMDTRRLSDAAPEASAQMEYDPTNADERALFDYEFAEDTDLIGTMKLRLWVQAVGAEDMDLFVAIEKLDVSGIRVPFTFYAMNQNGPAALGWLRVSHRALDPLRSRPERPVHTHVEEVSLQKDERVPVEIEIWASATHFRKGESLRLIVQGRDIPEQGVPNAPMMRHEDTRNRGLHVLHGGGRYDSYLLVPVVSARSGLL